MAYRETEKMRTRKAEARKRIIECTYGCVADGGFRSAQITRIAACAGVATGTIYRHFESKEDLFAEIFRIATQREVDKVAEALTTEDSAASRLEVALRQFAERALRGPVMAWSLIAEPVDPKVEEERLKFRRAYAQLFEQAIRDGIKEGCLPDQDARQSSTCLVGAIAESLVGPLSPAQADTAEQAETNDHDPLVNSIICFCMQGLTGTRR
ncbi:TetR/AcrR family transcriptional regulator [Marinobacter sp.]|jgi:AcrR family transcriptional regulator|uniref:TetR/AcrR family transcriptional regulator n=1 Tax=Marinobacter sp. TaxID=50741 RepID=UPI000C1096F5|nr:TetR/AcrR family transcriptional regulator [Marinobacter sp.]MBP55794.1 TetR family transcriptional regulator [Marinobacter sp.]PHQ74391.1 MAG: TetR family transcriptional regulator [Marinobacter sp.]|tara:strand:+ start:734 stop:1366 length:633 start_codon:yes stop_codon:yes gene_type:complete